MRSIAETDPGSWFFNRHTAYDALYSNLRRRQAESFVAATSAMGSFHRSSMGHDTLRLCVGIPSIARDDVHYLPPTIGSLLAGLTSEERDGIHLIIFIPHSNPAIHPAYHEPWLANNADEILQYNVTNQELGHIMNMELEQAFFRKKGLYDYTYLMRACNATLPISQCWKTTQLLWTVGTTAPSLASKKRRLSLLGVTAEGSVSCIYGFSTPKRFWVGVSRTGEHIRSGLSALSQVLGWP